MECLSVLVSMAQERIWEGAMNVYKEDRHTGIAVRQVRRLDAITHRRKKHGTL